MGKRALSCQLSPLSDGYRFWLRMVQVSLEPCSFRRLDYGAESWRL